MTLETELLLSTASNYYYSTVTPFLSRVSVWRHRFMLEAFDDLRTQILHKVKDKENVIHLFIYLVRK
jgi:hypothetical protein